MLGERRNDPVPSFTKKAIVESFLRIIGKKPLEKITVRDVVDDCGINRNTFYYYFQDIYAVLEEVSHNVAETLPKGLSLHETFAVFFRAMAQYTATHPRIARGLFLSLGTDGLERYFAKDMDGVILRCLGWSESAERDGYSLHVAAFLRHAIFGFCIDLMRTDKAEQAERLIADVLRILQDAEKAFCPPNTQNTSGDTMRCK
jgi:AcrR family transcriptional regulator